MPGRAGRCQAVRETKNEGMARHEPRVLEARGGAVREVRGIGAGVVHGAGGLEDGDGA